MTGRQIKPGDVLTYETFTGERRTITVTDFYDDIKNGRSGFDGVDAQGNEWWGYSDQVVR